jgi:hypothetical protein
LAGSVKAFANCFASLSLGHFLAPSCFNCAIASLSSLRSRVSSPVTTIGVTPAWNGIAFFAMAAAFCRRRASSVGAV